MRLTTIPLLARVWWTLSVRPCVCICVCVRVHRCVWSGDATKYLLDFVELNLPKGATLGVSESKLGNVISETAGVKVKSNETVLELMRGIRMHFPRFVKALKPGDAQQAMLGLGHSYSRSKVKFNVHRVDNMIMSLSTSNNNRAVQGS